MLSKRELRQERRDSKKGTKRERKKALNLPSSKDKQKVESKDLKKEGAESRKNTKSNSRTFKLKTMKRQISLSTLSYFLLSLQSMSS